MIAADLRKQKTLYADSRAIQQIIFTGKIKLTVANTRLIIYYILEQSKEKILHFSKGTPKVLSLIWMVKYSKVNIKLTDRQLKQLKTAVENKKKNNSENEFKNILWKWSASWIITDNKTKNEAKKCVQ